MAANHDQPCCPYCREVVRDSQMTVPETPSPDFVARGRARRPLAAFQQQSALGARTGSDQVRSNQQCCMEHPALHCANAGCFCCSA